MEKRKNHITVNLTDGEMALLQKLAKHHDRKIADIARILLIREAVTAYAKIQYYEHPENQKPFERIG